MAKRARSLSSTRLQRTAGNSLRSMRRILNCTGQHRRKCAVCWTGKTSKTDALKEIGRKLSTKKTASMCVIGKDMDTSYFTITKSPPPKPPPKRNRTVGNGWDNFVQLTQRMAQRLGRKRIRSHRIQQFTLQRKVLITRRSQVQVLSPQPPNRSTEWLTGFFVKKSGLFCKRNRLCRR